MGDLNRLEPVKAAQKFIKNYFPYCDGALLAGSTITATNGFRRYHT